MSSMFFTSALWVAQALIGLAMVFAMIRLMRGPRAQDRVLSLDALYVNAMLLVLTHGIRTGTSLYFEAALVIGCLALSDRGAGQVPPSRRGDRMTWAAGILIVLGALLAFSGSLGLLRFKTFYERVHPPTMGTTLGTGLILIGSMLYFSSMDGRPVVHEVLIGIFMTLSTPVTYMLLVRAALHRDRAEGRDPLTEVNPPGDSDGGTGRTPPPR